MRRTNARFLLQELPRYSEPLGIVSERYALCAVPCEDNETFFWAQLKQGQERQSMQGRKASPSHSCNTRYVL